MTTNGSSDSGSIISNNNNSNNSNWSSNYCAQNFFLFQIKTTGRITPLMGHCLRNRYNGENDPTL